MQQILIVPDVDIDFDAAGSVEVVVDNDIIQDFSIGNEECLAVERPQPRV